MRNRSTTASLRIVSFSLLNRLLLTQIICLLAMECVPALQRFGVKQKEKIASFKTSVDVLTLSATPIPRTLYLALTGFRDAR